MHKNSGRSLAVRVGALTAALSLMLAGGVAMASSASASGTADKDSAPGQQSASNKPKPGGTVNDPNGGAVHGDNGAASGNNKNPNGNQNSNDGTGGTGHLAIDVCHATRSANNPYVLITVDFSSVDEAFQYFTKGTGNGHGDHVGEIWDGQRSGVNWGDIIESISGVMADGKTPFNYPGYNLGATSVALGGTGAQILANGCNPINPLTFEASTTVCAVAKSAPEGTAFANTLVSVPKEFPTQEAADQALAAKVAADYTVDANACGGGGNECNPATQTCSESQDFAAQIKLCKVVDGKYQGIGSVDGKGNSQKAADEDVTTLAYAESTGDNIIPPVTFTSGAAAFPGYNWNEKTQARFNNGNCSEVLSVISANPLPATVAPAAGKPAPAKTPTKATLPASVPAGDGSSLPGLPLWALAMVVAGAIGAAAAGKTLVSNRK